MSTDRWMDKEVVVHIYNGIVLSHKKEQIWVSSGEVDEPRACHIKWNKSEREKQILHINTYIWNLEKWPWWTYLQGSNRDTDIENRLWMQRGKESKGWTERGAWSIYVTICETDSCGHWKLLHSTGSSTGDKTRGRGRREAKRGDDTCTPMTESHWCTAEANTTL